MIQCWPKTSFCEDKRLERTNIDRGLKTSSMLGYEQKVSKLTKTFEKIQIQIRKQHTGDYIKTYDWRSKTQLPISKVMFYKVLSNQNQDSQQTLFQVSYQYFPVTLADLKQISIQNTLYLLKESIIGFERLFNIFGSFLISYKMIAINKNKRCKVWINENFVVNQPIAIEMFKNKSEKEFLEQIVKIFSNKSAKSKTAEIFFTSMLDCSKFTQLISTIQKFSNLQHIQIPNVYQSQDAQLSQSSSALLHPLQMMKSSFQNKQPHIPKFLNKSIQSGQKPSTGQPRFLQVTRQKSRSLSRTNFRTKTPISKLKLKPSKTFMKKSCQTYDISAQFSQQQYLNDESFELKHADSWKSKNSESDQSRPGMQLSQEMSSCGDFRTDSELGTTHSNDSTIRSAYYIEKKGLFDEQRNMAESILTGPEIEEKGNYITRDLQKLGKLGKNIGESFVPKDFLSQH